MCLEATLSIGGSTGLNTETDATPDPHPQRRTPESPPQHGSIGTSMCLGPDPNPRLGSQASIPRGLAPKPSRRGTQEPDPRTLPDTQRETMPFLSCAEPSVRGGGAYIYP